MELWLRHHGPVFVCYILHESGWWHIRDDGAPVTPTTPFGLGGIMVGMLRGRQEQEEKMKKSQYSEPKKAEDRTDDIGVFLREPSVVAVFRVAT